MWGSGKDVSSGRLSRLRIRIDYGLAMVLVSGGARGRNRRGWTNKLSMLLQDEACVRLNATPLGRPLYAAARLLEEFALSRMTSYAAAFYRVIWRTHAQSISGGVCVLWTIWRGPATTTAADRFIRLRPAETGGRGAAFRILFLCLGPENDALPDRRYK